MNRGTIISMKPLQMMPTFVFANEKAPEFLSEYAKQMKEYAIHLPSAASEGTFQLYSGDLSASDKGEILIWQPASLGRVSVW